MYNPNILDPNCMGECNVRELHLPKRLTERLEHAQKNEKSYFGSYLKHKDHGSPHNDYYLDRG